MHWLVITTIAYFLIALEIILDKFLLSSKRVSHPASYTFYSGLLSLFALALFPFGAHAMGLERFFLSLLAGILFAYGILSMFFAIQKSEASRVIPVVGAIVPAVTYFLSLFFLKEQLGIWQLAGVALLILGGLLISFEMSSGRGKFFFAGFYPAILSGIFLALSFTLLKNFYERDSFINVFVWTRLGVLAGALSLFIIPEWRKAIVSSLAHFKNPEKEHKSSGIIFIFNKALGGGGSLLLNFAIFLGSVTIVNALVSMEYIFIFILGIFFSGWASDVFREKVDAKNTIQKISAIIIITAGIILVSNYK